MKQFSCLTAAICLFAAFTGAARAEQAAPKSNPEETAAREWKFLNEQADNPSPELAAALLEDTDAWLSANGGREQAAAALIFKAEQQIKLERYKAAVATLAHHVYEFPESSLNFKAKALFNSLLDKRVDRRLRQPLLDALRGVNPSDSQTARLAKFLTDMSDIGGAEFYEPLLGEYEDFMARNPGYPKMDELLMSRAALRIRKGLYLGAVYDYERILAVYPESALLAKAKRLAGDVYYTSLKNNGRALECYQYVVDHFATSDEAGTAYNQMAKISEGDKQYELAVDVYEKIARLYEGKDTASDAMFAEANILFEKLKRPQDAVNVLVRVADKLKGPKGFDALMRAAAISHKDLRDYDQEIKLRERIVSEYPDNADTPSVLFDAGMVYEKNLLNPDKAVEIYQQVADRYAGNSAAKSAGSRLKSLRKPS
ncbi:MAG: tetratricopeptide repeat protein [Elusimicrobiales bacterium]